MTGRGGRGGRRGQHARRNPRRGGLRAAAAALIAAAAFAVPNLVSIAAAAPTAPTTTVPATTATTATTVTSTSTPAGTASAGSVTATATGSAAADQSAPPATSSPTTAPSPNASPARTGTPTSTTVPSSSAGTRTRDAPLAVGPAFTCTNPTSFLSQGSPSTQLFTSVYGAGSVTYNTLGSPYSGVYNALGYDPANNYLYAVVLGTSTLVQIDSTGAVTSLGSISGYTAVSNAPSNGAFDGSNNFWITAGNGATKAYEINVTSSPPAVIATLNLSSAWQPIDFTYANGFMWGMDGTTIYRLNLTSGAVSTYAAPSAVKNGNFGAAWTFSNTNLGFSNNQTGAIYQIAVTTPSTTPGFSVISNYTGPVAGSSNDGAACVAVNTVDLSITKTGPALVNPSGTITWTITVKNNGTGNSSGFAVNDSIPSGVTNVTSPTSGCAVSSTAVLCSEGALPNGSSFTITVTGTAPSTNGTCFNNLATVTGNETDPTPGNNSASVSTCTTPAITLVKSANVSSFSAPGTVVTYSYLVTNTSTTTLLNQILVTDPMSGLSTITCPKAELTAGTSMTCTATYTTTQANLNAGSITNIGTVSGSPPSGSAVTATSTVTIPAVQSPPSRSPSPPASPASRRPASP